MTYVETIQRLLQARRFANNGLETIRTLCRELGHPEKAFPTIHVAGTNGKGSVATKIAKALEFAGLRVGLYTSPHIADYRERIRINGEMISESDVVEGIAKISEAHDATFFELTTALAFWAFQQQKVDIAVIETGLGGRLDATNLITPLLSVITSISYDHTAVLGETLEEIASEKDGIIKYRIPVVIGPHAHFASIYAKAEAMEAPITQVAPITGFYDEENQQIAKAALRLLVVPDQAIERGLSFRPPCRFEQISERAILDVAHNPQGFERLFEALTIHYPGQPIRLVVGFSRDKEIVPSLAVAVARAVHIHLVLTDSSRSATPKELAEILEHLSYSHYSTHKSISHALSVALEKDEIVVVCGTFFVMAEARSYLASSRLSAKNSATSKAE